MSADLFLRAADALRSSVASLPVRVQAAWEADGAEIYAGVDRSWVAESLTEAPDDGVHVSAYIVLMHPLVALNLAEWLEGVAELRLPSHAAFNLARAILREKP